MLGDIEFSSECAQHLLLWLLYFIAIFVIWPGRRTNKTFVSYLHDYGFRSNTNSKETVLSLLVLSHMK